MREDKINTRIPLNSPLRKSKESPFANPSYQPQKLRESQYRDPGDVSWMPGNSILRRYATGALDFDYAVAKIFEAMNKLKNGGVMLPGDQALLALVVPELEGVDLPGAHAATMIKLSPEEKLKIRLLVGAETQEMLNWNAGRGGGSTPNRTVTLGNT